MYLAFCTNQQPKTQNDDHACLWQRHPCGRTRYADLGRYPVCGTQNTHQGRQREEGSYGDAALVADGRIGGLPQPDTKPEIRIRGPVQG